MRSAIYEGHLAHCRHSPARHQFRAGLFMMFLDLEELPRLFDGRLLWSYERFNVASFRRADYLGDPDTPLDRAVRDLVEQRLGRRPAGPIAMLTHLRYLGYCFNPLTFYFCYDEAGERVDVTVGEVTNTPWRERQHYVLEAAEGRDRPDEETMRFRFPKRLHVSPFMPMDMTYVWRMTEPRQRFSAHIALYKDDERRFDATLTLDRREIGAAALASALARRPWMTGSVLALIHWHALRLWMKGCPFHTHPSKRPPEEKAAP